MNNEETAALIRQIVDQAPPLTEAQRLRISALLRPDVQAPVPAPTPPAQVIRVRFGGPASTRYLYACRQPVQVGDVVETPASSFAGPGVGVVVEVNADRDGWSAPLASIVRVIPREEIRT